MIYLSDVLKYNKNKDIMLGGAYTHTMLCGIPIGIWFTMLNKNRVIDVCYDSVRLHNVISSSSSVPIIKRKTK